MNKLAKILRILTIAPVMALILIISLYIHIGDKATLPMYIWAIVCICIMPILSYPMEKTLHIMGRIYHGQSYRACERKLAIAVSMIAYTIFAIISIGCGDKIIEEMALTYLLSGWTLGILAFVFRIDASGHMCGATGPIVFGAYAISPWYISLALLLIPVVWSSLALKRHTIPQLLYGALTPIVSFVVAIAIL